MSRALTSPALHFKGVILAAVGRIDCTEKVEMMDMKTNLEIVMTIQPGGKSD